MPDELRQFVVEALNVAGQTRRRSARGLLALQRPVEIVQAPRRICCFRPTMPRFPERVREHAGDCFAAIREKDMVVHHPYEMLRRGGPVPAPGCARS